MHFWNQCLYWLWWHLSQYSSKVTSHESSLAPSEALLIFDSLYWSGKPVGTCKYAFLSPHLPAKFSVLIVPHLRWQSDKSTTGAGAPCYFVHTVQQYATSVKRYSYIITAGKYKDIKTSHQQQSALLEVYQGFACQPVTSCSFNLRSMLSEIYYFCWRKKKFQPIFKTTDKTIFINIWGYWTGKVFPNCFDFGCF